MSVSVFYSCFAGMIWVGTFQGTIVGLKYGRIFTDERYFDYYFVVYYYVCLFFGDGDGFFFFEPDSD